MCRQGNSPEQLAALVEPAAGVVLLPVQAVQLASVLPAL
jgi:hypothetical protein